MSDKKIRETIFTGDTINNYVNINRANFLKTIFQKYHDDIVHVDFSKYEKDCYFIIKPIIDSWDRIIMATGTQEKDTKRYMNKVDIIGIINENGDPEYALIIRNDKDKNLYKIIQRINVKQEIKGKNIQYQPPLIEDFDSDLIENIRNSICNEYMKIKPRGYKPIDYKDDKANGVDIRIDNIHFFDFNKKNKQY